MADKSPPSIIFRKLEKSDDRVSFDCGVHQLNEYLHKYARQNQKLSIGVTYIATYPQHSCILGYYTLSSGQVSFENLDSSLRKRMPRYPVPVIRIGRLARDLSVKNTGMGTLLLIDAFTRIVEIAQEIGVHGIEVHAKDENAKHFYLSFGFQELLDDPFHLYLSVELILDAFFSS